MVLVVLLLVMVLVVFVVAGGGRGPGAVALHGSRSLGPHKLHHCEFF